MNPFMKISIIRGGFILLVAIEIILFVGNNAHAQFMKKLAIEPPVNPNGWERTFKSGIAFSLMLEDSLNESGQFQVVRPSKKLKRARKSNLLGNSDDMSQGELFWIMFQSKCPSGKPLQANIDFVAAFCFLILIQIRLKKTTQSYARSFLLITSHIPEAKLLSYCCP